MANAKSNGKSNDNTLLALGIGAVVWYLWSRSQTPTGLGLVPTVTPISPGPGFGPQPTQPSTQPTSPTAGTELHPSTTASTVGKVIGAVTGLPIAGPAVAAIAQTEINAVQQIASGDINPVNVAEVALLPVAVTATAVNAIADLFGWSGHPLDTINDVLLTQINDPNWNTRDNVPPGASIYAMDTSGQLHYIQHAGGCSGDTLWCAHYSWREIIAVPPDVFGKFPIGADITDRSQINPMGRPGDPSLIRQAFGNYARFKVGTTELHGPWDLGLGASAQADAAAAAAAAAAASAAAQRAALIAAQPLPPPPLPSGPAWGETRTGPGGEPQIWYGNWINACPTDTYWDGSSCAQQSYFIGG